MKNIYFFIFFITSIVNSQVSELYTQNNAASQKEVSSIGSWVGYDTKLSVSNNAYKGSKSIKIVTVGDGESDWGQYKFKVKKGAFYRIKIWAKSGSGSSNKFRTWVGFKKFSSKSVVSKNWKLYEWYLEADRTGDALIRAYSSGSRGKRGDHLYIDNISITGKETTSNTHQNVKIGTLKIDETSDSEVKLSWTKPSNSKNISSYYIYKNNSLIRTVKSNVFKTTVRDLKKGVSYSFKIRAKDKTGNLSSFSNTVSTSLFSVDALLLKDFKIVSSYPNRLYFNSSVPIKGTNHKGFKISGKLIQRVSIKNGSTHGHYFIVSNPFTFWDNNTIRYSGGSNIKSYKESISLSSFSMEYVENKIKEPNVVRKTIYLSTTGNDKNNGLSQSKSVKTFKKAISLLPSEGGGVIYVKAGKYQRVKISTNSKLRSGKMNAPHKIIGYRSKPGDLNGVEFYKYTPKNANQPSQLNPRLYPVFDGLDKTSGIFFHTKNNKYFIWKNIAITNYKRAFDVWSKASNWCFDNIVVKDIGNSNYNGGTAFNFSAGSNNYNRFKNIKTFNSTDIHFFTSGNYNAFINCKAFSTKSNGRDDIKATTDYYYNIRGSNNIVYNSLAYKNTSRGWGHNGHGFSLKARDIKTEFNLIQNCEAVGIYGAYQFRHPETQYSVVKGSVARSNIPNRRGSSHFLGTGAIHFMMGASNNTVEQFVGHDIDVAITFSNNTEERVRLGAKNNTVKNSVFYNANTIFGATYSRNLRGAGISIHKGNKIYNNTFRNVENLFTIGNSTKRYIKFSNLELKNNIFDKVKDFGNRYFSGWNFNTNNFSNGIKSLGANSSSYSPSFKNETNNDFRLQSYSKLIDKGVYISNVKNDFNSLMRVGRSDIGAHEFAKSDFSKSKSLKLSKEEHFSKESFVVYPNPVKTILTIKRINENLNEEVTIKMYNLRGNLVHQGKVLLETKINVSRFVKGFYSIHLIKGHKKVIKKVAVH